MLILGLIKLLFMLKVKTQHIFITLDLNIFLTVLKMSRGYKILNANIYIIPHMIQ